MAYDVVIKGGRIYDGSGLPSYFGDVAINGDRIVEVGRINQSARRTVDAAGLAVAPGFIDFHTHMDAQLLWEPAGNILLFPRSDHPNSRQLWPVARPMPRRGP